MNGRHCFSITLKENSRKSTKIGNQWSSSGSGLHDGSWFNRHTKLITSGKYEKQTVKIG
jgi:hypothetical protein